MTSPQWDRLLHWNWWPRWRRGKDHDDPPRCAAAMRDHLVNRAASPTTSYTQEDAKRSCGFKVCRKTGSSVSKPALPTYCPFAKIAS